MIGKKIPFKSFFKKIIPMKTFLRNLYEEEDFGAIIDIESHHRYCRFLRAASG